jgi:hypothetical protein
VTPEKLAKLLVDAPEVEPVVKSGNGTVRRTVARWLTEPEGSVLREAAESMQAELRAEQPVRKQSGILRPLWPGTSAAVEAARPIVDPAAVALAALGNLDAVATVQQAVGDDRAIELIRKAMREAARPVGTLRLASAFGRPGSHRIW